LRGEKIMGHFSNSEKVAGELAVRGLSKKAQNGYSGTDSVKVYAYTVCGEDDDFETVYAYEDMDGLHDGLTEQELEAVLESFEFEEDNA
jgi:hypothetical protein